MPPKETEEAEANHQTNKQKRICSKYHLLKGRCASGVCDRRLPVKLKEKFYRMTIRPAIVYGLRVEHEKTTWQQDKCWRDEDARWMSGKARNADV